MYSHFSNSTLDSLDFSFYGIEGFEHQFNLDPRVEYAFRCEKLIVYENCV